VWQATKFAVSMSVFWLQICRRQWHQSACYSEEETGRSRISPSPLLAVPYVTAHASWASVPNHRIAYCCITVRCCTVLMLPSKGQLRPSYGVLQGERSCPLRPVLCTNLLMYAIHDCTVGCQNVINASFHFSSTGDNGKRI